MIRVEWSDEAISRLYAEIGESIRKGRVKSNLTQIELANIVELTRSSIANIEAGRQRPPVHIIFMIAQAFNVSAHELIPSTSELDTLATIGPTPDLEGRDSATQEFITGVLRQLAGG